MLNYDRLYKNTKGTLCYEKNNFCDFDVNAFDRNDGYDRL